MKCKDCYARNGKETCLIGKKSRMLVCGHYGCDLQARVVRKKLGLGKTQTNADVAQVNNGRWLTKEYMYGDPDVGTEDMWIGRLAEQSDDYAYCSICGKSTGYNGEGRLILSDYCPNCGAKMYLEE